MASTSQPNDDVVTLAVMGATGAGKSTFINLVSNSDLRVGYGLESCTSDVQVASPFMLDGKMVTLIDTPGFDDTVKSEAEILRLIADFLSATYEQGRKLNGVIFLHRISDHRMGGVARKNFRLFRKLCGEDTLDHVVVVTNMWNEVKPEVGNAREAELASNELFFKSAIEKGARLMRHDDSAASAHAIVRSVLGLPPTPLLIQRETVDEGKPLAQTCAGIDVQEQLESLAARHREELDGLKAEMQALLVAKDTSHQGELEEMSGALRGVQGQLEKVMEESKRLVEEREADRAAHDAQVRTLIAGMEEKETAFRALQDNVLEHRERIEHMETTLRAAEERAREQEMSRKKAEEELKAAAVAHQAELERVKKEFEKKLESAQREAMVKARLPPLGAAAPPTYAQQQWAKVIQAQRERRGIFATMSLVLESFLGSTTAR